MKYIFIIFTAFIVSVMRNPVLAELSGDANSDGNVDGIDYVIWFNHYDPGVTQSGGIAIGDFNNDTKVDGLDYVTWMSNYNVSASPTHTPTPSGNTSCKRAYAANSPWNTPIGSNPNYHPNTANLITAISGNTLGSNPDQYTYPVYEVKNNSPLNAITISGSFSNVTNNGSTLNRSKGTFSVPIPLSAQQSAGTDGQIIIINTDTGDEWGFWQAGRNSNGTWHAVNGYHYNINWSGVMPAGFMSRGAGVTYLSGLIRACEIKQGHIDHAIAFAYEFPCSAARCSSQGFPYYVSPATKSDGKGDYQYDFPEGTRLQLVATDTEIDSWCSGSNTCKIMARALREYGMITIDNSGSAKIYPESNITAKWGATLTSGTPNKIPLSRFKVIQF